MVYVAPFVSLLPEVSTKAPVFITIFISPPVKFFIPIENTFDFEPDASCPLNVKLEELTVVPFTVTVTFDELNDELVLFKAVSSLPVTLTVYTLLLYDVSVIVESHVGGVTSFVNEYVLATLVLPDVSFNAPAEISILTVPPVKLLIVKSNVIVLSFIVPLPLLAKLKLVVAVPFNLTVTFCLVNDV